MKSLRVVIICIFSIFAFLYLAFLFILPNFVDLNRHTPQVTDLIQKNTGFKIVSKSINIKTSWDMTICAIADKTDLIDPDGEKFAQINALKVKISVIPLLFKKIRIDKISAQKVFINLDTDSKGEFLLKKYLINTKPQKLPLGLSLSKKMPDISVNQYRVSVLNKSNKYSIKGMDLKITDFAKDEKISVKSYGQLVLNDKKQISYKVAISSSVFPKNQSSQNNIVKVLDDLYKYNIRANILADLDIKEDKIDGNIDIDKISFVFAGKAYPESTLKMKFKNDKAHVNASLRVDNNSKAIVTGFFKTGKNKFINLDVVTDKIQLEDIVLITKAMSRSIGLKDLSNINAKGDLKAKFSIESDFKKIKSSGYLNLKNAIVVDKVQKIALDSINADIDFSQNGIKIKQASAKLNSQPILITGGVDGNANANIAVSAKNLPLKGFLLSVGQVQLLNENLISAGSVSLNASLKGRLDKVVSNVNLIVQNASIKNMKSNTFIKLSRATVLAAKDGGQADISGLKISQQKDMEISLPKAKISFDENEMNVLKTYLYIGNIKSDFSAKLSSLSDRPVISYMKISIPNQISVPIKGYDKSKFVLKGDVNISGDLNNPKVQGAFSVPLISVPSISFYAKDSSLKLDKSVLLSCPYLHLANSSMSLYSEIDKNFSNGIVVKNTKFVADVIDLNSLAPVLKNMETGAGPSIKILGGKSSVGLFKVGKIVSTNIDSDLSMSDNTLYLRNLFCDAYGGRVAGSISYNLSHRRTKLNLQGRGLSANPALLALTGINDDINGIMDFDSNVSIFGHNKRDILQSLKGDTKFIISNGRMGILGKFEHLLYAQNIVSNNIFKATLNAVAKAVTVKNTGVYKYMKGKIYFANGWANIESIKTSGPSMSLYISGRYYLPTNIASLTILGRISDDVVRILGPLGEFSMNKVISSIPKIGEITTFFANQYTVNPSYENISEIPYLSPKTQFGTKEFKVVIDGDARKQSSVKSFKWISNPKIVHSQTPVESKPVQEVPDFVKNLPDYKN